MAFFTWLGRVALWIVFAPLGLWRSIAHGRRKREQRATELAQRMHAETLATIRAAQPAQPQMTWEQHIQRYETDPAYRAWVDANQPR